MTFFLVTGAFLGAILGICHAILIIQTRREMFGGSQMDALWPAIWACVIWTFFGPYLLLACICGAVWFAVLQIGGRTVRP
ncbi:MAG: hypothetical protein AAGH74_01290 [Pseudomonadota bacterium]